ncbi:MAG: 3-phosphoshikimate 1-carboxyvinyltransferase [Candidatus Omnitrophota bacterium]|nr:3-phosphoshikimate 1-carboxyvinyltransferase [Candidatus Omnitrophota bacterium]
MNLQIKPASYLEGSIIAPASKSYTIRVLFIACLAGRTIVVGPSNSQDAIVAKSVCSKLGAKIKKVKGNTWLINGVKGKLSFPSKINVQESGTSLRFLLSLATLTDKKIEITGCKTLSARPNRALLKVLRKLGAKIRGKGVQESVPIIVETGNITSGNIAIDGRLSSQFISSLLITLPLLSSKSSLKILGNYIVSLPYIDMTKVVLKLAGIKITRTNKRHFLIAGRQRFKGLKRFVVPADYGLAAFIIGAGILCKSQITIKGIGFDKLIQADKNILPIIRRMGVKLKVSKAFIKIRGPQNLKGAMLNLKDSPDLVPVVAVLALFAQGKTRIYGIGHVRLKESDRISDLRKELIKTGADIREKKDELIIYPKKALKGGITLDPHQDHRLAMAFSILGLKLGLQVKNIECVKKSYPNFLSDLKAIKAQIVTLHR